MRRSLKSNIIIEAVELLALTQNPIRQEKSMIELNRAFIHCLPKAELHCHLDGSLRVESIIDLAKEQGIQLPADSPEALRQYLEVGEDCKSLEEYLQPFAITNSILQTEGALIRTAYELCEDSASENIRYLEIRFSPILHIEKSLKLNQVVEAVLKGAAQAEQDFNIKTGIIICGIRHIDPENSLRLAELCIAYKNRGVVGFDLAGVEENFPAKAHKEAFYLIANNNINTTVHAGEAYGPESIHQAIHYVSANRIGHGTRLKEDGDLLNYVNDHRIPLEMCVTSNVQTKSVRSYEDHPIRYYFDYGIRVTVNTDNRLISKTTLTDEYLKIIRYFDFTPDEIRVLIQNGFKSAFMPLNEKRKMLQKVNEELAILFKT